MAAPTQALPSYLSFSTQVVTRPDGGVATHTSLVELPLTYYGPSIPLGENGVWTYGGLTSPASSPTASSQSATTSAIPSSSASIISSTSSSSSATSSTSATTSSLSSSVSSSPTTSSSPVQSTSTSTVYATSSSTGAPAPASKSSLNKGALIGIVLGSILGTLLLLLLALLFLRWRRRRQDGGYQTPIWTGWEIVDPTPAESQEQGIGESRPPGEGSPRGSGEEADSFLRRSGTTDGGTTAMADTSTRLASVPPAATTAAAVAAGAAAGARGVPRAAGSGSNSGTNNSGGSGRNTESTAVSDYGILLHGSDYTDDPSSPTHVPARPSTDMGFIDNSRRIIPPSELLRIEREREEQDQLLMRNEPSTSRAITTVPEHYSPLSPPPLLNPDHGIPSSSLLKASSSAMSAGSGNEQDDPMVLTARRVRLSQLGPRSQPELRVRDTGSGSTTTGGWGSLGLGGIARLSRLSWFKSFRDNLEDPYTTPRSRHGSRPSSWTPRPLSDHDIEAGRALLDDGFRPPRALGTTDEGERPGSSVSARSGISGNTVYHDAESTPGTPPAIPSLPRAYMSSSPTGLTQSHGDFGAPPLYEPDQPAKDDDHAPRLVDVLDIPAPASVSQFSSASSRSVQFPPGLVTLQSPRSWYESSSSDGDNAGISIDVLEDTPPRAGDGWRAIARNATLSHPDHRTSFGIPQFGHTRDLTAISEVGSLHSMRSHLSPTPPRSSGSAPASMRHDLSGSNSSRPSTYSHSRTASSGRSLAHSTSISFNDQRRTRGAVSPSLSAFGPDSPSMGHFPTSPPPPYMPRSLRAGPRESIAGSSITATEATYANVAGDHVADHYAGDAELLTMPWATGFD